MRSVINKKAATFQQRPGLNLPSHKLFVHRFSKGKNCTIMADRTSARLFGKIFTLLARNPTDEHKEIAKEIAEFTGDYDFSPYQMDADDSLIKLGLAEFYTEDGEINCKYNF